jgi:hypothetical protein
MSDELKPCEAFAIASQDGRIIAIGMTEDEAWASDDDLRRRMESLGYRATPVTITPSAHPIAADAQNAGREGSQSSGTPNERAGTSCPPASAPSAPVAWRYRRKDGHGPWYFRDERPDLQTKYWQIEPLFSSAPTAAQPEGALSAVLSEVEKAVRKFPTWPTDPLHAVSVLGEEYGELVKAVLQLTYEPHKTSADEVRMEAIQTAAMALRFLRSLNTYQYARCFQHKQEAIV